MLYDICLPFSLFLYLRVCMQKVTFCFLKTLFPISLYLFVRQVGVTPGGVELPRSAVDKDMEKAASLLPEDSRPCIPTGPDRKWRYMWRIGPRPPQTKFQVGRSHFV